MKFCGAFLLVLLPLLGACVPKVDMAQADAARATMKPTVTTFDALTFMPVTYPSESPMNVTIADPVYDFGSDGLSYLKAIELPKVDTPYVLDVVSDRISYGCFPCHPGIFVPKLLFLDAAKKPLAQQPVGRPAYTNPDHRHMTTDMAPGTSPRYLIIYTTGDALGQGEEAGGNEWGVAPAGPLFVPVPPMRLHLSGTPIGSIAVILRAPNSLQ